MILDIEQLGIGDTAGGVGAHGFEDVADADIAPLVLAGQDGAAVEHQAGDVGAQQGHGGAGDGFVAGDQGHHAVEHVAAHQQLDGIGDHLAADERGLHALSAHGDAVADGDGIELHGSAAGRAYALLHLDGQLPQVVIAGHGLDPGIGHADDGLGEVLVGEADGFQHGAGWGAVAALGDGVALEFHRGNY